jgi:glycosyltransferase involved in cell wall biosynthesis
MDRAGIETWLMNILRHIDRRQFQMEFLVETNDHSDYDEEIRALGSKTIPCSETKRPLRYARDFSRIMRQYGPYDFVHCHFHYYSGWVLRLAYRAGIPNRIVHSHTNGSMLETEATPFRRLVLTLARRWIKQYATGGLACSKDAGADLFGKLWEADRRWKLHYSSIDVNSFRVEADPVAIRTSFGIPSDALVVGHVARFAEVKNHSFLLDIAVELSERKPEVRFLLIGDGPLRTDIQSKAKKLNLDKNIIFAGVRADVPWLMLSAMDIFLLPSLLEGLPLVLIEAQTAGLPCIFSECVTEEADVIKPLIYRVSLSQPASFWVQRILAAHEASPTVEKVDALSMVARSPFNVNKSVKKLEHYYFTEVDKNPAPDGPVLD